MGTYSPEDPLTRSIIGLAIEVHRALGPGMLESAYEECLAFELKQHGFDVKQQLDLPVVYKEIVLERGYRLDLPVEDVVIIELKSVEALTKLHEAQLLTYMRLSGIRTGLLLNFNARRMVDGIRRFRI